MANVTTGPVDRDGYPLSVGDRVRLAGESAIGTVTHLYELGADHFAYVQPNESDRHLPVRTDKLVKIPVIVDERNVAVCGTHGTYYIYGVDKCAECDEVRNPIIGQATEALRAFGGRHLSPARARMVLEMWARRDQLTQADVEQVIQRYRGGAR